MTHRATEYSVQQRNGTDTLGISILADGLYILIAVPYTVLLFDRQVWWML